MNKGFKLVLAVSRDGYLASGPNDDMKWTGKLDKQVFRLLTMTGGAILAGGNTFDEMPQLKGRLMVRLSRSPRNGLSLAEAATYYPGAWLIGGPQVAREALLAGLVERAFLCHSETALLGASEGDLSPYTAERILELLPAIAEARWEMDDLRIDLHVVPPRVA